VALQHSRYQVATGKIGHTGPHGEGVDGRLGAARIFWRACGENVAYSLGHPDTAQTMVDGWMNSPGHRSNILNASFTHSGLGVAVDKRGGYCATQVFAQF
jgi:uncharacterized protein YkwD